MRSREGCTRCGKRARCGVRLVAVVVSGLRYPDPVLRLRGAVVRATRALVRRSESCKVLPTRLLPRVSLLKTLCTSAARDADSAHLAARLPMPSQDKTNRTGRRRACWRWATSDVTAARLKLPSHVSRVSGVVGRFAGTRLLQKGSWAAKGGRQNTWENKKREDSITHGLTKQGSLSR